MRCVLGLSLLAVVLLSGCSGRGTVDRDQVRSAAIKVRSIAAEGELFTQFVIDGRATLTYVHAHPYYLRQLTEDLSEELAKQVPAPSVQQDFQKLQRLAAQLQQVVAGLNERSNDQEQLPHIREEFAVVRAMAAEIERTL
jgi:hypothetical protein